MYKIYADDYYLIYDSMLEDYKIGKGVVNLEANKAGSFTFTIYPGHFFYDNFVEQKTIITVYREDEIIFRGRVLNTSSDYWNNKTITCEGELSFFNDSVIRPFSFQYHLSALIATHNAQVDEFKHFKYGEVTVTDGEIIAESSTEYTRTLDIINNNLIAIKGGVLLITHENGDKIPTLNYLSDYSYTSTQTIEFGANLKDFVKTSDASELATIIIPLGAANDDGSRLTIRDVTQGGADFITDEDAISVFGKIVKVVSWDDITDPIELAVKGETYLKESVKKHITIELTAIDLHLLDRSIESFKLYDYIRVKSGPHNFDNVMLCSKQTIDLLKPDNDKITLGYTYSTLTSNTAKIDASVSKIPEIQRSVSRVSTVAEHAKATADNAETELSTVSGDVEAVAGVATENARNIVELTSVVDTNTSDIAFNKRSIENLGYLITSLTERVARLEEGN